MDPEANIKEQRELATRMVVNLGPLGNCDPIDPDDVYLLAELVLALDEWRTKGGFDPYKEAAR